MKNTRLIITGGTIDKKYNMFDGTMGFDQTHVHDMLKQSRFGGKIIVQELLMKDSLEMNADDRCRIADAVLESEEDKIVITHGTDTMVNTGQAIAEHGINDRTVVLTGAMIPYSLGVDSDAQFNLGSALAYAHALPSGIYVAMNGESFPIDNVQKDTSLGIFVPRFL